MSTSNPFNPNSTNPFTGQSETGTRQKNLQAIAAAGANKSAANANNTGPKASNLQEQQANIQTSQQMQQVQTQGQLQQVAIDQQKDATQQEFQARNKALDLQTLEKHDNLLQQAQSIIDNFAVQGQDLQNRRDSMQAEALGQTLRLSNESYLQQLHQEAAKSRLNDRFAFQEQLNRTVFDDEKDLFASDLRFRAAMNGDQRAFNDLLSTMDLEFAMQVASAEAKGAANTAMYQGLGGITQAGIQYSVDEAREKKADERAKATAPAATTPGGVGEWV